MRAALVVTAIAASSCVPGRRNGLLPPLTEPAAPVAGSTLGADTGAFYLHPGESVTFYPSGRYIVRGERHLGGLPAVDRSE